MLGFEFAACGYIVADSCLYLFGGASITEFFGLWVVTAGSLRLGCLLLVLSEYVRITLAALPR